MTVNKARRMRRRLRERAHRRYRRASFLIRDRLHLWTYADSYRDEINDAYEIDSDGYCVADAVMDLVMDDAPEGMNRQEAEHWILYRAAQALRDGLPVTLTGPELDVIRHLMPAACGPPIARCPLGFGAVRQPIPTGADVEEMN
jgi:hypothetical protein